MLKDSFCSSPWFHLRLTHAGEYQECRWFKHNNQTTGNIATTSIMTFYNSDAMKQLRTDLLNGSEPSGCDACYYQDRHSKLSGRIKQLNKSGIQPGDFDVSTRSSPHYKHFLYSHTNNGQADYYPVDLQIDLGNICNSACIMCSPEFSSRLYQDYVKLHKISNQFAEPRSFSPWTQDPVLVEKFIQELKAIPNLRYIHLLGGETFFNDAFYIICQQLIDAGLAQDIIIGTTTNGTIYDSRLEDLISQFKEFHLGISIESIGKLNDYVRYPATIDNIKTNIDKFLALREKTGLHLTLRITPNIFTISELDQLLEYAIANNLVVESCNILYRPEELRIELLPNDIKAEISEKLGHLINKYNIEKTDIVNTRRQDLTFSVIANIIVEYKQFIDTYQVPNNVEELRYKLVDFLKAFESIRNNTILDYAPEYTEFLRTYGY